MNPLIPSVIIGLGLLFGIETFTICLNFGEDLIAAATASLGWWAAFSIALYVGYLAASFIDALNSTNPPKQQTADRNTYTRVSALRKMVARISFIAEHADKMQKASKYNLRHSTTGNQSLASLKAEVCSIEQTVADIATSIESFLGSIKMAATMTSQANGFTNDDTAKNLHQQTAAANDAIRKGLRTLQSNRACLDSLLSDLHESDSVSHTASSVHRIKDSIKEQLAVSDDIARNVDQIAKMAEEHKIVAIETAKSANSLQLQASAMKSRIKKFKHIVVAG